MKEKLIIFGNGQIAEVAYCYLSQSKNHEIVGFCVHQKYNTNTHFLGLNVFDFETIEKKFPPAEYKLFAPVAYHSVNSIRKKIYEEGKLKGYNFATYVHPNAINNAETIGENCFILEQNVLQPRVRIGDNVVLWSGNHIGHHSVIENHVFLASHVVVSGAVTIGERTFIGVNATLRDNIVIGKENIIGAGALILSNTEDYSVFPGTASSPISKKSYDLKKI